MISKIYKKNNKKGFTLTEIIIVVAIIVILAGAGLTGVLVSIHDYNAYKQNLEENGGYQFEADARTAIENLIKGGGTYKPRTIKLNDPPTEPASATPTPGGGGGDTPTDPTDPADTEPSSSSSQTEPTSTSAQTPDPALPSNNGGGGGGGVDIGGMNIKNGFNGGNGTPGVIGGSSSGNKTTLHLTDKDGYNDATITITNKGGGSYGLSMDQNQWVFQNRDFPGFSWGNWSFGNMTSDQKNWFTNNYGITFN